MKASRFAAVYRRLVVRRGVKKAIIAVAHRSLVAVYHMLLNHVPYQEPSIERKEDGTQQLVRRMQQRIERLGYTVILEPVRADVCT